MPIGHGYELVHNGGTGLSNRVSFENGRETAWVSLAIYYWDLLARLLLSDPDDSCHPNGNFLRLAGEIHLDWLCSV